MQLREESCVRDLEIVAIEGVLDGVGVHHQSEGQDRTLRLRNRKAMNWPDTLDDLCLIDREEIRTRSMDVKEREREREREREIVSEREV
jgi:hypothetical protein